ncbi:MAG: hypothetical protein ACK4HE_10860 [Chitinophagaceae bacterium]
MKPLFLLFSSLVLGTAIVNLTVNAPQQGTQQARQKLVAEATVEFTITSDSAVDANLKIILQQTTKTLYIKGSQCRVDIFGPAYKQTTIIDGKQNTATIFREIGDNKFVSILNTSDWKAFNSKYDDMKVELLKVTKKILNYDCLQAIATLKDGNQYTIWYAPNIYPSTGENSYQFKGVPGFVLEYDSQMEGAQKSTIRYTATKISLLPVPTAMFQISTQGYRLLQQ